MNVVSLFSGCGGLDYGFEKAGFQVAFFIDCDRHACATLRLNGRKNISEALIEDVSTEEVRKAIGSANNKVDVLIGGPPCQPFSKSAYWSTGDTLRLRDSRANTLSHYLRFVEELQPRVFLLENVHGLNYSGKEEGFQYILKKIREINNQRNTEYVPSWAVLNTVEYGVPQLRVRFFLVAERTGRYFKFPPSSHVAAEQQEQKDIFSAKQLPKYVTAWEAIHGIRFDRSQNLQIGGKWGDLLPSIPEGENYLWHTNRKGGGSSIWMENSLLEFPSQASQKST